MSGPLPCFKAYDIRGRLPDQLNEDLAFRIGRAFAAELSPKRVVVGRDVRQSSLELSQALARGLNAGGCDVLDIGLCGTEQVYFATPHLDADGGIMVTASHNPMDYNGMKLVRRGSLPISGDTGLDAIEARTRLQEWEAPKSPGQVQSHDIAQAYVQHLLSYLSPAELPPLKVVANAGNGCAGPIVDLLTPHLPSIRFLPVHHQPDGSFPNGIPNPLLPENRAATSEAVIEHGADLGLAWDGDFDRCFFFDHTGRFIEGYYIVGLLAAAALAKHPGSAIVHDPRLTWNTIETVTELGGRPIQSKTGHAFIKERMRLEDAVYGGEMSGHHYFRDFHYCDSGMIPALLVLALLGKQGKTLAQLVDQAMERYPCSGEINFRLEDPDDAIARVEAEYGPKALLVDHTDGVSMEFDDWRFNLRRSNTEPVVRLNVEGRGNKELLSNHLVGLRRELMAQEHRV